MRKEKASQTSATNLRDVYRRGPFVVIEALDDDGEFFILHAPSGCAWSGNFEDVQSARRVLHAILKQVRGSESMTHTEARKLPPSIALRIRLIAQRATMDVRERRPRCEIKDALDLAPYLATIRERANKARRKQ